MIRYAAPFACFLLATSLLVAQDEIRRGKIKAVDASGRMVTLDDGTQIVLPPTLTVERQALLPGANVKSSDEEKDGQKVAKSFTVMPPAAK